MGATPDGLATIASLVSQQECLELQSCSGTAAHRILSRTAQITDRFIDQPRDPHGFELSGSGALGQHDAVPTIGLDVIPRAPRCQRRRNHFAGIAALRQVALQRKPCRTSFVHEVQGQRLFQPLQCLDEFGHVVRHLANQSGRRSARLGHRDADAVLVHVQADVKLATLFHGRPPSAGCRRQSQPCSSARSRAQPTSWRPATATAAVAGTVRGSSS